MAEEPIKDNNENPKEEIVDNPDLENEELSESEENDSEQTESEKPDSVSDEEIKSDDNKVKEDSLKDDSTSSEEDNISEPLDSYPVLIIDDDRWLQRIFSQYLKSWGFKHVQAMNSFEGVDMAVKHKPLLIFLDIIMPDVTGDITLKFLKGIDFLKEVPVVIISGNLNKEVLKNTYKDGAAGFISKPFTKDILYSKIKDVLDKRIFNRMVKDGLIEEIVTKKTYIAGQ
ncbi:response regulator [Candidatus Kapabacteria bacterium]|nr:response regulator [Candidatus Kapabacteria bacterium]